jgi:hypothetical protein
MFMECPIATDEEKAKFREKGAAKAAGKAANQKGQDWKGKGKGLSKGWPTATQWNTMYPGPTMHTWKTWYDKMGAGKGGKGSKGGVAAAITPGDPLATLVPMCYLGERANEKADIKPDDDKRSAPVESRAPSESLLMRCEPKLNDSETAEHEAGEWTVSKAERKKRKKKESRERKAVEKKGSITNATKDCSSERSSTALNMFNEKQLEGLNSLPIADDEWEELVMVIDSGASVPVMPPDIAKLYSLEDSEASKRGVEYECANGASIPNLGQKRMALWTAEGTLRSCTTQCADVSKPLQSVRHLVKNKHVVVFDEGESYIYNKITGETNHIVDDGINYTMKAWIVPPKQLPAIVAEQGAEGFQRQA